MELFADDQLIASETNAITPIAGEFVDAAVTINSRLLDPSLYGRELRVRLSMPNNASGVSVEFDDVRLAAFARSSEWGGDANATWDTAGAWIGTTPPTSGGRVTFGPTITADRVIAFGAAKSLAAIGFDNANRYWLRGTSTLTLASLDGVADVHDFRGSHTVGTPVVLGTSARTTVYEAGDVLTLAATVSSDPALTLFKAGMGTLELNTIDVGGLAVDRGRVRFLRFGSGSGVSATSRVRSLTLGGGGGNAPIVSLDLSDRTLVLDYSPMEGSPLAQVQSWIASGAATGRGILSSAPLVADGSAAVGFAEASAIGLAGTTYRGVALDATSLIIAYAYRGDTDLNGTVNFDDLLRLATHYGGTAGKTWSNGDADHDGNVDFDDLLAMAKNYNRTLGLAGEASSSDLFEADFALARALVPEPTVLFAIGLGGAVIGRRSRSRCDAVQRRA